MANKFTRNTSKISSIYRGFEDETLVIDSSYQRRKVWGVRDNVRLIETIIMDMVIPEIFMWDFSTNPDTGETITHIVDGQQRINAIFEFIAGKYKLQKKYLLDEKVKEKYGDKYFSELDDEIKKDIWSYELSIVNLNKNFSKDEIRNMFYRLNLTDYSLNEQEKRNSLGSAFGIKSEELANEEFWGKYKIFSPSDIRRMKDVEYCSSIILLVRDGVVDQTKSDKLDQIYKDYCEEYKDANKDLEKIHEAMKLINDLTEEKVNSFVNKKSQMYSLFSVMLDFSENNIEISGEMRNVFSEFAIVYSMFKNEYEIEFATEQERQTIEMLKRYKLASSEGVNKIGNRMIRYEILKKLLLNKEGMLIDSMKKIEKKMAELSENNE